jgi:arylsulfatase A-like enzyme
MNQQFRDKTKKSKPNVLMIMADQLNQDWLGFNGDNIVKTPHLDKLAEESINFINTACNCPRCAPSRASIALSQYPYRTGVLDNSRNCPLSPKTYYEILRENGYNVGLVGKLDLHKPEHYYGQDGMNPMLFKYGFSSGMETEGKMNAAMLSKEEPELREAGRIEEIKNIEVDNDSLVGPYQNYLKQKNLLSQFVEDYKKRLYEKPVWYANNSALSSQDYHDSYIGQKAADYLHNVDPNNPWHLFVSFVGPHDPWDAPEEYYNWYKNVDFPENLKLPKEGKPQWIMERSRHQSEGISTHDLQEVKRNYAGMISLIDAEIGRIISALEETNSLENTVIIFLADHGEFLGDFGLFEKSAMYEAALRVPLLISVPFFKNRGKNHDLVELVDLYPTILDICNLSYDSDRIDGKSLIGILKGKEEPIHKKYQYSEIYNCRMISDGRFKYIENYNDVHELYDLVEDPDEKKNINLKNEEKSLELRYAIKCLTRNNK